MELDPPLQRPWTISRALKIVTRGSVVDPKILLAGTTSLMFSDEGEASIVGPVGTTTFQGRGVHGPGWTGLKHIQARPGFRNMAQARHGPYKLGLSPPI